MRGFSGPLGPDDVLEMRYNGEYQLENATITLGFGVEPLTGSEPFSSSGGGYRIAFNRFNSASRSRKLFPSVIQLSAGSPFR